MSVEGLRLAAIPSTNRRIAPIVVSEVQSGCGGDAPGAKGWPVPAGAEPCAADQER